MEFIRKNLARGLALALAVVLLAPAALARQAGAGSLRGQVTDEFGGAIIGATVAAVSADGQEKTVVTDSEGNYTFTGLAAGKYTVRASQGGFATYENAEVEVKAGARQQLDITLGVTLEVTSVTVAGEPPVSTEPENNADSLVLKGSDLDALPDDPDELAAALQALAGPSGGPNGGQIFVDGFSGGRMPSRDSIREVRINQNPFTAENDRPGFGGRIEILTRPGTDKLRGSTHFTFMDESFNSRNPFLRAEKRPPFQVRRYGGNLSGPISARKASFFLHFERNEDDENDVINARVLDPVTLAPVPFNLAVLTPQRRTSFDPRVDYQINSTNTLVARYSFFRTTNRNAGLNSEFTLPTRAFDTTNRQHTLQLTETAILSPTVVNETRFQYINGRSERDGDNSIPAVNVQGAFLGGGAQVGQSFSEETRWELQNYTTMARGLHSIKFGGRLRGIRLTDVSRQNFGGTFVFNSLTQFANNVAGLPGGSPTQFTLNTGEPEAGVTQTDFGGFIQDDWKVRPNLTLSAGLRYEVQSNIDSKFNFAPRLAVAWSPGAAAQAGQPARTVVRGGFGIFYDRINENLTLQENRFGGAGQQQLIADTRTEAGRDFLSQVRFNADGTIANFPSLAGLIAAPRIVRQVGDDVRAPYTMFAGLQVERQLPKNFSVFLSVGRISARHTLRLRNVNAPLPGTFNLFDPTLSNPVRPLGNDAGDLLVYESNGKSNLTQMAVGLNSRLNRNFTLFTNYVLSKAESDTDGGFGVFGGGGIGSPANPYDFTGEYGRANFDVRHRFFLGGSFTVPRLNVQLNPFIQASSGRPFNITTGLDTNGDTLFTERPSLASGETCATRTSVAPNVVCTKFGTFNLNPAPGSQLIPRNFGEGPGFFTVNLRVGKTWGFGTVPEAEGTTVASNTSGQQSGGQGGGGRRGGGGGGGGRGGGGGGGGGGRVVMGPGGMTGGFGGSEQKRYNVTLSVQFFNLLNRANLGQPVGNLLSSDFGNSIALAPSFGFGGGGGGAAAGNRRIQAQLRFSF